MLAVFPERQHQSLDLRRSRNLDFFVIKARNIADKITVNIDTAKDLHESWEGCLIERVGGLQSRTIINDAGLKDDARDVAYLAGKFCPDTESGGFRKFVDDLLQLFHGQIAGEVWPQPGQAVRFKKSQAPFTQFCQIAGIDAETFEGPSPSIRRSRGHRCMDCAHVDIDRIEQQGRTIRVRVEPALKGDLLEMFWLAGARLDFRIVQVFKIGLLPVMRFGADGWNVESMRGFHVRGVVETTDECISGDVNRAFDIAIASQRKIRKPSITRRHAELHRNARRRHRQIESVLKLYFLRLGQAELAGDISERLLWKHDRPRANGPNTAGESNVLDCFGKALQSAAVLLEKS